MSSPLSPKTFFRFADEQGVEHIVDLIEHVPAKHRERMQVFELVPREPPTGIEAALASARHALSSPYAPYVALGFVTFFVVTWLLRWARRMVWVLVLGSLVGVAALGVAGYVGWARERAPEIRVGAGTAGSLLEDAERAVQQVREHYRELEQKTADR